MPKIAIFKTKSFQILFLLTLLIGIGAAIATDNDNDGMIDLYEKFFRLNPTNSTDTAENYDSDTLDNFLNRDLHIIFGDHKVCIDEVLPYDKGILLDEYREDSAAGKLFVEYFDPLSLNAYQSLFLKSEFPDMSPQEFRMWQEFIGQGEVRVLGVVYYRINKKDYASIQYKFTANGRYEITALMIKNVAGVWHPCSRVDRAQYGEIPEMFKRHKLTSLRKYFIKTGELSRAELKNIKGKADGYIHFGKLDGTCYMDRLLQGLDANDASVKSFSQEMIYSSLTGLEPDALRDLETENVKFKEYLSSIGISAEKKQSEVLERIKKGNFLSASSKIKEITGADSDDAYILKIRKIYGENTIYIK